MKTALTVYSHNFCTVAARLWRPSYMQKKKIYANRMHAWAPHANYIENNHMKILFVIIFLQIWTKQPSPGGLEPPIFWLTADRANQ